MKGDVVISDVISVPGIHCSNCAMAINRALSSVAGLKSFEVDVANKKVDVTFDPVRVELGKLIEAIERAGYEAFPG